MNHTTHNRRTRLLGRARRGLASGLLVFSCVLVVSLAALAFNVARLNQAHDQLRTACQAAALAGAAELLDESLLYGTPDQQGDILAARLYAQQIAAQHLVDGQPISLDANLNNAQPGDIVVGQVQNPGLLGDRFWPFQGHGYCNSIVVNAGRYRDRGNGIALWAGKWFGLSDANVGCTARASLDHHLIGFRPKGLTGVPVVPMLIDDATWQNQRSATPTELTDRFSVDNRTGEHRTGPDGLIEIEYRCRLNEPVSSDQANQKSSNPQAGRCALLYVGNNAFDLPQIDRQCQSGLNADDLQPYGGELNLAGGRPLVVVGCEQAEQIWSDYLWAIRGQRRAWPLALPPESKDSGDRWTIVDFVAGTVVDAYVDFSVTPRELVLCVQPSTLATSTALTRPDAPQNACLAKLLLNP